MCLEYIKNMTLYAFNNEGKGKIIYACLSLNVTFLLCLITAILIEKADLHHAPPSLSESVFSIVPITFWHVIYFCTIFIVHGVLLHVIV